MKPHLAVFRIGGITDPTLESLVTWQAHPKRHDWSFAFAMPDADVARARSVVATSFYRDTDCDVLVMMDHDIQLNEPGDLDYLAEKAHETEGIVGAVVPVKGERQGYGCRFVDGVPHELLTDELVELVPPAMMGGALTAYHRSVFSAILEGGMVKLFCPAQRLFPFFMPTVYKNPDLGELDYLSEDWAACLYAHEAGKKVYAALRPFVVHHGKALFTPFIANPHEV
jgi:hypothetical protein